FLKRARRLTSLKPVTVYIIIPENSLTTRIWSGLKDKTAASDLALDGKLSRTDEKPIDRAAILREMQERGARLDGSEVPEPEVQRMWANWQIGQFVEIAAQASPANSNAAPTSASQRASRRQLSFDFLACA